MSSRGVFWVWAILCGSALLASPAAQASERAAARPAAPPVENAAVATDARLGGDEGRTRFIVDLSRYIEFTAFTLADPYRVVIDLPQVAFQVPAKTGEIGRGLVK